MNDGLLNFQLKPPGLNNLDLFQHMIKYRKMHNSMDKDSSRRCSLNSPSEYLQVEISNENKKVLDFKRAIVCGKNINAKRLIIEDTAGKNAMSRLARRKIDSLGNIKSHSCIVNNECAITKLENKLKLAESMSFITKKDKKVAE